VRFDGDHWHDVGIPQTANVGYPFGHDRFGNFWFPKDCPPCTTAVQWTGQPHSLDTGAWVSPTRWVGAHGFTPLVQQATYSVAVEGAISADGMPAAPGEGAFTVAYAGGVTTLPPNPPTVSAPSVTPSLKSLGASWMPNSTDITQYRYAIGTTPGGRNVVGWMYLTATSFTRNDLTLVNGQTYYVTVQARNAAGLWSVNGVSGPVLALQLDRKVYLPSVRR
jgi:hypothetical protein